MEQQQELLQMFRTAIQCNVCFEDSGLSRGHIKVAHPRPIGPRYLASLMKILVLMINPGKGRSDQDHRDGETRLRAFANGQALIEEVFHSQRVDFHNWGRGRFLSFYEGLGLDLDEVALVNLAWCSEMHDKHPAWMLNQCLKRHTAPLLQALNPDVILLSGGDLQAFTHQLAAICPKARILPTLHFSNRESRDFVEEQGQLIRAELNAIRSAKAVERRKQER